MTFGKDVDKIIKTLKSRDKNMDLKLRKSSFFIKSRRISVIYENLLESAVPIIKVAIKKSTKLLAPRSNVTFIVVSTFDDFVKNKMDGVAGYTYSYKLVSLRVNTASTKWKRGLIDVVAHEFNHTVRRSMIKYVDLREDLASEGLAQTFAEQISRKLPPWSKALSISRARTVAKKYKPHLKSRSNKLYARVFWSVNDKEFPHWSGYTISYLMAKKRLSELKMDWNDVMKLKAKEIIQL